jgi:hypothetical protein
MNHRSTVEVESFEAGCHPVDLALIAAAVGMDLLCHHVAAMGVDAIDELHQIGLVTTRAKGTFAWRRA